MKKVLIITPTLSCAGGRERVMSNFSKYLGSKLAITFLTLNGSTHSYYPLHKDVIVKTIETFFQKEDKSQDGKLGYINDILKLRKLLKEYKDYTIISTDVYITIFLYFATLGRKHTVIANEHLPFNITYSSKFWEKARNFTYPKVVNTVVTLTDRDKQNYENIGCRNSITIPNALTHEFREQAILEGKIIIAVGRFTAQKGFDFLIDAFSKLAKRFPDWSLNIFGEGPLKEDLKQQINTLRLDEMISLKPPTTNIQVEYLKSDIYVLSSRYEAFPMVLIEAMSFGLPTVAFDCETGPAEIIQDKIDGLLVKAQQVDLLAENLAQLMSDKNLRKQLGAAAFDNIKRLSPEMVFEEWYKLIQNS